MPGICKPSVVDVHVTNVPAIHAAHQDHQIVATVTIVHSNICVRHTPCIVHARGTHNEHRNADQCLCQMMMMAKAHFDQNCEN